MADRDTVAGDHRAGAGFPLVLSEPSAFTRLTPGGGGEDIRRPLAIEMPIAIEIDGIGYAVMMATPGALDDFATGFCLSERLIDRAGQLLAVDAHAAHRGVLLRLSLAEMVRGRVMERVRHRVAESSCGLCGIENLEQALRPLPRVPPPPQPVPPGAIFAALAAIRDHQPLGRETGAVHAAALCSGEGAITIVREDVGRHNAFDKLVGAMARGGEAWGAGFALTTARLSYELVEKAALAGCHTLAAISAPTTLAIERAGEAGVRVIALARSDALLEAQPSAGASSAAGRS